MLRGAFKACPDCGRPAQLTAPSCAVCGHVFRTRFSGGEVTQGFSTDPSVAAPHVEPPPVIGWPNVPQTFGWWPKLWVWLLSCLVFGMFITLCVVAVTFLSER